MFLQVLPLVQQSEMQMLRQGEVSSVGAKTPRASIWVGEASAFAWLSRDLHGQLSRVITDAAVLDLRAVRKRGFACFSASRTVACLCV